jgi:hypothetical protein
VEGFENIFKYTFPIAFGAILVGGLLFFFFKGTTIRAISITIVLFGVIGYAIDFFAKERADIYYDKIITEIKNEKI